MQSEIEYRLEKSRHMHFLHQVSVSLFSFFKLKKKKQLAPNDLQGVFINLEESKNSF